MDTAGGAQRIAMGGEHFEQLDEEGRPLRLRLYAAQRVSPNPLADETG